MPDRYKQIERGDLPVTALDAQTVPKATVNRPPLATAD